MLTVRKMKNGFSLHLDMRRVLCAQYSVTCSSIDHWVTCLIMIITDTRYQTLLVKLYQLLKFGIKGKV